MTMQISASPTIFDMPLGQRSPEDVSSEEMTPALDHLRIADVLTFLAVQRHGSITAAARDLRVTPSQVSKAVVRLEAYLKKKLLVRQGRGIVLSADGRAVVPLMDELVDKARLLQEPERSREAILTVAAPSYLCSAFLPVIVRAVTDARVRGLEVGPAFMRAYANEGIFEVALSVGEEQMPASWVVTRVGQVRKTLFAAPTLARRLGARPSLASLRSVPFVCPIYNSGGQFMPGDDGCPLARSERIVGHEAATLGVALEIAAASEQLVFGPVVAARQLVDAGKLVEVKVPGWHLTDSLYLHANADIVLARVQKTLVSALRMD
jgi:DNA-binding transcriptional LysR family regulator